jgi:hypothetical protein
LLCLGSFFLVHFVLGLCARFAAPALLGRVKQLRARHAADVLLALRLGPTAITILLVVALCAPSYLRFEPLATEERVGWLLWAAAGFAAVVWMQSCLRAVRALRATRRRQSGPVLRLTGILSPRVDVSGDVKAVLSEEQWNTVLRHENAHAISGDNLKRLLILLAPGLMPFDNGWRRLEDEWVAASERAADAAAVDGDSRRALALAEALVRLARHGVEAAAEQLTSSFATNPDQLRLRVQCLLDEPPSGARRSWILPASGAALFVLVAAAQAYQQQVHELLELLVD